MPVSIAVNFISFVAQPGVLHLTDFQLYSPMCIVERVFLVSGLWIIQVGFVEAMFLIQQLLDCLLFILNISTSYIFLLLLALTQQILLYITVGSLTSQANLKETTVIDIRIKLSSITLCDEGLSSHDSYLFKTKW